MLAPRAAGFFDLTRRSISRWSGRLLFPMKSPRARRWCGYTPFFARMTGTRVVGLHRLPRPAKAGSKHAGDVLEGEPPLAVEDGEVVEKALGVRGLSRHEPMAKPRPHGRFLAPVGRPMGISRVERGRHRKLPARTKVQLVLAKLMIEI